MDSQVVVLQVLVTAVNNYRNVHKLNKDHKVVFTGDSHARGCAMRVKDYLDENFEVSGFVKLNACTDTVTITTKTETEKLKDRERCFSVLGWI